MSDQTTIVAGVRLMFKDIGSGQHALATFDVGNDTAAAVQSPVTPAAATVKTSAGRMYGWVLQNSAASLRSVKFFDTAGAVTMGTTPALFEIDIPAGGVAQLSPDGGVGFFNAIKWAVTSAKGLTDSTVTGLALNDVSGAIFYA